MNFGDPERKEWLISILKSDVVKVKFEKVDGTERLMTCTLKEEFIPKEHHPKGTKSKSASNSLAVYDTEVGGWRSFRLESVKEVNFTI